MTAFASSKANREPAEKLREDTVRGVCHMPQMAALTYAIALTDAEGKVCKWLDFVLVLVAKTFGIELLGVLKVLGIAMEATDW